MIRHIVLKISFIESTTLSGGYIPGLVRGALSHQRQHLCPELCRPGRAFSVERQIINLESLEGDLPAFDPNEPISRKYCDWCG